MHASGALEIQEQPETLNNPGGGTICIVRCMVGPVRLGDKVSVAERIDHLADAEAYISSIALPLKPTDLLSAVMTAKVTIEGLTAASLKVGQRLYTFGNTDD